MTAVKKPGQPLKLQLENAFLKGKERGMQIAANPRKRRKSTKRKRRRNAGIVPFVAATPTRSGYANPLILNNPPKRRRRRRKNPALKLETVAKRLMIAGGGSAIGATGNILGLNKIEDMWFRNGARIASSTAAAVLLRGELGAAAAGAFLYPVWQEVALRVLSPTEADLEDDLDTLAADLEDVLDDYDDDDDDDEDYYDDDDDDDEEYADDYN
jgi:hypothetical protein